MMPKLNPKSAVSFVLVAAFFLLLGIVVSTGAPRAKIEKALRYNRSVAQKLYNGWDKESIFLPNGRTFAEFERENDSYAIYFWATWCPHCRNAKESIRSFDGSSVPLVGLPFDTDAQKYAEAKAEFEPFWEDITLGDGGFVPREGAFDIPSIPSVWFVENGKVRKIFVGESGLSKLPEWLKNRS